MVRIHQTVRYNCTYENSSWRAVINEIQCYGENYIEFTARARGSRIKTYFGKAKNRYWVCFPELDKGCYLADLENRSWNLDKLSELFESIPDALTVVEGIEQLRTDLSLWWDYNI